MNYQELLNQAMARGNNLLSRSTEYQSLGRDEAYQTPQNNTANPSNQVNHSSEEVQMLPG